MEKNIVRDAVERSLSLQMDTALKEEKRILHHGITRHAELKGGDG